MYLIHGIQSKYKNGYLVIRAHITMGRIQDEFPGGQLGKGESL
jgi:hypothetical protein